MTEDKIHSIVNKLKGLASTNFSDYCGFRIAKNNSSDFHHCFIVNDQRYHSSNFTVELTKFEDALEILMEFSGQSKEGVIQELMNNGSYIKTQPLFLHYLKLVKQCEKIK